jgi:hypothetical protein
MLTLEVYGKFITWPEDFALLMMKYYRKHGVDFILHRNCVHTGWDNTTESISTNERTGPFGAFEYSRCSR